MCVRSTSASKERQSLNSLLVRYNNSVLLRYVLPARLTFDARNICANPYSMERDTRQYDLNHIS